MSDYSTFLFAKPSLVEGAARLLDFGNTFDENNYSKSPEEADRKAIECDWDQVGLDLWEAIRQWDNLHGCKA
jgi:hypothetical protein